MKTLIISILFASLAASVVAQQSIVDQFEERSLTLDGYTLPYRLFVPADYDPETAYPLVLALHGAGERGTDNERHIRPHRLATSWADPENQAEHPAFVVAPQVPSDQRWTAEQPVHQSDFHPSELTTLAILDSIAAEFTIDPDRVYVTGLSMGGHGTWDLISRLPHRFAAAVPMSGNAYPNQAPRLMHLPIWAFQGESDTVVRPAGARSLIQAMEDLGRDVVYTDCRRSPVTAINFDCSDPMSNAALKAAIMRHADLILTSEENVGHGPWSVWYDHPLLADWLFSKHRIDPDAIAITEPAGGARWSGVREVTWSASAQASDTVEVWIRLSPDDLWEPAGKAVVADGRFALDTASYPDAAHARIRLLVLDGEGRVYGRQTGEAFSIDNAGDAAPYLSIDDEALRFNPYVESNALELTLLAADPEGGALSAQLFYSIDGGNTYALVGAADVVSSLDPQDVTVDVAALPNSREARLRVDVSDGSSTTTAETASFSKVTPRETNAFVQHVQGDGEGSITMHFIDPDQLTGHRYRITIDGSDPAAKTYDVIDLDAGTTVLAGVPLSDGVRESPIFDGMSLVVEDLEEGMANLEETGWISGETNLGVAISGGSVLIAVVRVQLLATENDYEITVTEAVADTSTAGFGMPSQEIYFRVTGRDDGIARDVLFRDAANDGKLGDRDVLYILEEDADGEPAPAWELRFTADNETILPDPGDTFLFVPLHKLSASDVFEFEARLGVAVEREATPDGTAIVSSFPNPFTDRITIFYRLAEPAHARLDVYDVLGRRVAVLLDRTAGAGEHRVDWDGRTAAGLRAPSGLHVIRLTTTLPGDGAQHILQHAVVRVR